MTGRPLTPVGANGSINAKRAGLGWVAETRVRDQDGETRRVRKTGPTKAAAINALRAALVSRAEPVDSSDITRETEVAALLSWWADEVATSSRTVNTKRRYREVTAAYVLPRLGGLRLRECSTTRVDRALKAIAAEHGAPTARLARTVLTLAFGTAINHGAMTTNPAALAGTVRVEHKPVRALTDADIVAAREAARAYVTDNRARGPKRSADIVDVVELLLATGARIGEILALRWSDVDLAEGRIAVAGTLVLPVAAGEPITRQPFPKGKHHRSLLLPDFGVAVLLRRSVEAPEFNPLDAVFPSTVGTWKDPSNVRKQWNRVRAAAGLEWVTPHSFRKTVATRLNTAEGVQAAASQLGHSSVSVTERHYVERVTTAPDRREILADSFAPRA